MSHYGKPDPQMNYAKLIIADDAALFGSSNFHTNRTAGGNAELAVMKRVPDGVHQPVRWFEEDEQYSTGYWRSWNYEWLRWAVGLVVRTHSTVSSANRRER